MGISRRDVMKAGALASAVGLAPGLSRASAQTGGSLLGKSYAETATARPWMKPQRPGPAIAIDVHTHWAPPAYLKAKADLGRPDFLAPINADLDHRIAEMDASGIAMEVLTLGGFRPWVWVTPAQGAMISAGANDAAIAAHAAHPTRFLAGIELNASDPAGAVKELNRVAGKPGMVCVHLPTSLAGRDFLFEDDFQPVLARIHELGLPILLHPLDGEDNWFAGHRLADRASGVAPGTDFNKNRFPGLTNSLGNSLEMAVCIAKLISSGTLDRYPNLTLIATCGGGAVPYVAGRLENRGGGGGGVQKPVWEYLRRFYYDSLTYWPTSLRYLAEMVGPDRVVLGTDNMHAGTGGVSIPQPHSLVDQAGFSDSDRQLILAGNLKRLFKL